MQKRSKQIGRVILGIITVVFLFLSVAAVGLGLFLQARFEKNLPTDFFRLTAKGESPKFYAYDFEDRANRIGEAKEVTSLGFAQKQSAYVSYPEIPKHLVDAFVAIEDKRFWEHNGVDWYRTAAASVNLVLRRSSRFGASTVTQQVVKNVTGNNEVSLSRKMQEIFWALDLERSLDKTEIMEIYLNVIHFSDNCNGVGEAARHYFSKTPAELTVAECATIAAITNSPSYYNPIRNPQNNLARRNLILSEMYAQGYLTESEYTAAKNEPLSLSVTDRVNDGEGINSWYVDMVIEDVIGDLMREYGISRSTASGLVYSGGLRIDIAIDEEIQKTVEEYYRTAVQTPTNESGERAQSALVVIDPKTGDVLGVAGAIGEKRGNRVQNFATQTLRPPGSTIKPLSVYAPALEMGLIDWASVYDDVPVRFGEEGRLAWPKNANGVYRGLTNISYAVAHSTNTVAVRVLEEVGLENAYRFAKERFHLESLVSEPHANDCDLAALALGQLNYGVTLRELTAAYTAFADTGVYHPYRSYYRVTDGQGNLLLSNPDRGEIVLSVENAAIMTKLLQGVVTDGTSSAITLSKTMECAGKTGTTNADHDRWFVGYTPELICGVWCGFEYPEPMQGKNVCTQIWNRVMRDLVAQKGGKKTFDVPSSVIRVSYCKDSGKLMQDACTKDARGSRQEIGWFVKGQEPTSFCDCHVTVEYDTEHGGICHGNCPEETRAEVSLIRVERHIPIPLYVSDAQYVYGGDPTAFSPEADPSKPYFAAQGAENYGRSPVTKPFNRSCTAHPVPTPNTDWEYLLPKFLPPDDE